MSCSIPSDPPHEGLYKMGPAYSLNNETDIMLEIFHYGPVQGVQVSFDRVSCIVTQNFLS